jgi:hypothetical protein
MLDLSGRRCVAISYAWRLAPTIVRDFHALLSVVRLDGVLKRGDHRELWREWTEEVPREISNYRISFEPEKQSKEDDGDISGVLGLLGTGRSTEQRVACEAFERAVSDALVWELSSIDLKRRKEGFPLLLVEGPILPKLRGRLYYQFIASDLPLLFVTYKREWVRQLLNGRKGESAPASAAELTKVVWEGPIPSLPIDSSRRCFLCSCAGEVLYHVEFPANTLPAEEAKDKWDYTRDFCESLFCDNWSPPSDDSVSFSDPRAASLPVPLAASVRFAELEVTREYSVELGIAKWLIVRERSPSYTRESIEPTLLEGRGPVKKPVRQPRRRDPVRHAQLIDAIVLAASPEGADPSRGLTPVELRVAVLKALNDPAKAVSLQEHIDFLANFAM